MRAKSGGLKTYQSGHSMPKTAINFLKMKKGLYMNESMQSRSNLHQPQVFSQSEIGKYKGLSVTNQRANEIYDQSPMNMMTSTKPDWKSSSKLASTQPFLIDKHNYNSLEQNFDNEFQQRSLPKYNNQGFLSDLEEFMNINYITTATDSKGPNVR